MPTLADLWTADTPSNTQGLDPQLASALSQAQDAYRQKYGKELPITSGFRTTEQQAALAKSGNKYPVAAPGTSLHEKGLAVDIDKSVPDSFLQQFGLHRPLGSKDPVHTTLMPQAKPSTLADLWEQTGTTQEQPAPTSNVPQSMQTMLAQRQQGQDLAGQYLKRFGQSAASLADVTVGSIIPSVAGAVTYAGQRALQHTPEEAAAAQQQVEQQLGQPFGKTFGVTQTPGYQQEAGRQIMDFVGQNINKGAQWISQKTGVPVGDIQNIIGTLSAPAVEAIGPAGRAVGRGYQAVERLAVPEAARIVDTVTHPQTGFGAQSIGAAQLSQEGQVKSALAQASPETQAALRGVPASDINLDALNRHVEADSLPVPVRLTKGQASQDVNILSQEQNNRGKNPELAQRFNEQNGQLMENINAIRDKAAPDVYATNHVENAENIINAYKQLDAERSAAISDKYKALRDAAGGDIPIDAKQFANNSFAALGKELKTDFLPPAFERQLNAYREGAPMTYENFEAMRSNLAAAMRTAERAGDGNAVRSLSIVRDSLEQLPLTKEAADLKPLADSARQAARERFQLLEQDPAYQAAINDVAPDKFINKYVIGGNKRDLDAMLQQLGTDSEAAQNVRSATINWLKNKAGIVDNNGNFSQAGFNRALEQLSPKMQQLVGGETAQQLKTLGNVARYTQAQPKGSFVNTSNTLTGALAQNVREGIGMAAEKGLNVAVPGLQLGTTIAEKRAASAAKKATKESLKPGAGSRLSEIGKK